METKKKTWLNHLKTAVLLFFLGGVGLTLVFFPFINPPNFQYFLWVVSYQGLLWVILWFGNGYISDGLRKRFSWIETPVKTFIVSVLATLVFTLTAYYTFDVIWEVTLMGYTVMESIRGQNLQSLSIILQITAFVSLFLYGRSFLFEWRDAQVETEKLKREHLSSKYETLKNQVNPHFLFNSLNVLSSLVYKDQDLAAKFINQLSKVYRYVLETREKEVVSLKREMEALKSYIFLAQMRFGENLKVEMDLPVNQDAYMVAPLALQMLVENAIKHNIISKSKPLIITIQKNGSDYIVVDNNLQRKEVAVNSNGIGLENIKARYKYLADKEVIIQETEKDFIVKLPLIPHAS